MSESDTSCPRDDGTHNSYNTTPILPLAIVPRNLTRVASLGVAERASRCDGGERHNADDAYPFPDPLTSLTTVVSTASDRARRENKKTMIHYGAL